jgi:hypothetical protein
VNAQLQILRPSLGDTTLEQRFQGAVELLQHDYLDVDDRLDLLLAVVAPAAVES